MTLIFLFFLYSFGNLLVYAQDDEGPYKGKFIGKFNNYHHQISGDVYAVDEYTLLLTKFNYDGQGADTFFWAGAASRPGPQGFIVPDEYGKTDVLRLYFNKDFTLTLPDNKKITDIKWFAIYDLWSQNTFGDIYIPEEFEPPSIQKITQLSGKINKVTSGTIEMVDAKTIRIPDFVFDGIAREPYFWVGIGAQPDSKGTKVPDEYGYLDPLRTYDGVTISLELPGDLTIFNIDWFSIYDYEAKRSLASIIIPNGLNVPPSLVKILPHKSDLTNCLQLHKKLQVSWDIFGPQITIQLAGQVEDNEYMSFGLSGSRTKSQMLGSDVAIAHIHETQVYATDYNITALTPCVKVLGQYKGVCKDDLLGGQDNNQVHTGVREHGISIITFRRFLISPDSGDLEYPEDGSDYIIWAIGRLDKNQEPTFHDYYPKTNIKVEFKSKDPIMTCYPFTTTDRQLLEPWEKGQIYDRNVRLFRAQLGPSGGKRGYQGLTKQTSTTLAWYINGLLVPEIWMRRGLTYSFKVHGGNNPHSAELYHPLIITDEPHGGFDRLSDEAQSKVRVLAGVEYSRRGRPRPTAAGSLCIAAHKPEQDRRLDDDFLTFKKFNRTLNYTCDPENSPATLEVTPNSTWPDIVYYNSFTQPNMGWKIHIVDSYKSGFGSLRGNIFGLSMILCLLSNFERLFI
ncbi:hypothetical protein PPYR_11646 [Photinus pyralis]|uniref:DOMON domain-containing protein n=1 Tax=Photinus pyralis TaxID=7054 RepID=A0A1Y1L388_PHOPY|nr:protein Skeletor, isoforms B/C [Photinus pyralis]KAB0794807.1 hypothetical protein PPYR_11646 [Photinus pyralis]